MTTRDFWSYCGSLGLLAFLASWAALAHGVTGRLPLVGALLGAAGSAFYIQYELARRAQHRSHIARRSILLRCVLPAITMLGSALLPVAYFGALVSQG